MAVASPENAHDGDAIRVLGLLESLSAEYDTHFVSSTASELVDGSCAAIEALTGGTAEIFPRRERKPFPSVASAWLWARAIASRAPAPTLAHRDRAIARSLKRSAHLYDGVVLLDNAVAVYMPELRSASAVVVDVHNVAGWSIALADARGSTSLPGRVQHALRVRLMRAWERRTLGQAAAITVTSADEGERMRQLYGIEARAVVPSGSAFPDDSLRGRGSGTVGWLGGLGYGPNRDGLLRFLDEGWPLVAAAGYRLEVAGRGADDAVNARNGVEGVAIKGFVDDLGGFLRGVDVAVVPLWAGAGVKLKTVTFLGAGVPVVTTAVGAEGTGIRDGLHAVVGETPVELARALLEVLRSPERADALGAAGRKHALETLTWEVCGAQFVAAVDDAVRGTAGTPRPSAGPGAPPPGDRTTPTSSGARRGLLEALHGGRPR